MTTLNKEALVKEIAKAFAENWESYRAVSVTSLATVALEALARALPDGYHEGEDGENYRQLKELGK